MTKEQLHPVFGSLSSPWYQPIWNAEVTVCFTPPDAGWTNLVLISSAYSQHHIASLSYIGAPFYDLLNWLTDIINDQLPASVLIDEEGKYTRLSVLPYDEQCLEFRAVRIYDYERSCIDVPDAEAERNIVCRINKYQFIHQWRRRFADFILHDFKLSEWEPSRWDDYLNYDEFLPRYSDIRRFDFSKLDAWLESNCPRTVSIERIISDYQSNQEVMILEWAIKNGLTYGGSCPAGRKAEYGLIDAKYELVELPLPGYRFATKANIRDADTALIISMQSSLSDRSRLACLFAQRMEKPWLHLHPDMNWQHALSTWLNTTPVKALNITVQSGGDDSQCEIFLKQVLDLLPLRAQL
jgi:Circularly permutated YpsA SLOG family